MSEYLLPYCIKKLADGGWVALNRHYKPCGFITREWVEYEAHPIAFRFKRALTRQTIAAISWNGEVSEGSGEDFIFLYSDACRPLRSAANMNAYLGRLKRLMSLQLQEV
jgi:hypothetical protein